MNGSPGNLIFFFLVLLLTKSERSTFLSFFLLEKLTKESAGELLFQRFMSPFLCFGLNEIDVRRLTGVTACDVWRETGVTACDVWRETGVTTCDLRRNTGVTEFDVRRDFVMDLWRGLCVAGTEMRWDLGFTETGVLPDFDAVECRDFVVTETKADGIEFRLSLIISPAAVDIEFKFEGIASSFDSI